MIMENDIIAAEQDNIPFADDFRNLEALNVNCSSEDSALHCQDEHLRTRQEDLTVLAVNERKCSDLDKVNENTACQMDSPLNEKHSETSDMGCIYGKESSAEPLAELKSFHQFDGSLQDTAQSSYTQSDSLNRNKKALDCKDKSLAEEGRDVQILYCRAAASNICRPKEPAGYENPIVSSFTTGSHSKSHNDDLHICLRTAEEGNIDDSFCGEKPGFGNNSVHPGRAVRVNTSSSDEVNEYYKEPDGQMHADKDDSQMFNENLKVNTDQKEENKFRGIDQKWRTNDDDLWEEAQEKYEYFWRTHDIYSQWHYSVFFCGDLKFTHAEQYMMYQKAILFGDCRIANKILQAKQPRKMKSLGRKVSGFNDDLWSASCLNIVKDANIAKFSQNQRLKECLFATFPKVLVEASPLDAIWGIGCDMEDPDAWDETTWRGKNYLGFIITEVRDELMFEAGIIEQEHKKVYLPKLKEQIQKENERLNMPEEGTEV